MPSLIAPCGSSKREALTLILRPLRLCEPDCPKAELAIATWRPDDEIPFFRELRRVTERHLGAIADQRYSFGEAAPLEALLRDAGFHEVRSRIVLRTIHFGEGVPFPHLNTMALVGMSSLAKELSDQESKRVVEAIVSESAPVLQPYTIGSGLAFELGTNLATAKG
ncbi:hypothetical protein BQ8794_50340 [Mesorhizobium prunaredense]|uniref:Uncharacterized protein n=1 Tax=Mesorhizobium prunaredense TaxID=1631249 RepID=A0A1R3VEC3_9HYPH|nr:hypothetical protein [Mesorhizobium prunaredense]SIT58238.1 hypothetical protein BQ8794_50340 [Mesorhizobium prunaredense]